MYEFSHPPPPPPPARVFHACDILARRSRILPRLFHISGQNWMDAWHPSFYRTRRSFKVRSLLSRFITLFLLLIYIYIYIPYIHSQSNNCPSVYRIIVSPFLFPQRDFRPPFALDVSGSRGSIECRILPSHHNTSVIAAIFSRSINPTCTFIGKPRIKTRLNAEYLYPFSRAV